MSDSTGKAAHPSRVVGRIGRLPRIAPRPGGWFALGRLDRVFPRWRRAVALLIHVALVGASYRLAFEARFDFDVPRESVSLFWTSLAILIACRLAAFSYFGLFRGYWRHFGIYDALNLAAAVSVSTVCFVVSIYLLGLGETVPRSIFLIDWGAAMVLCGGVQLAARYVREGQLPLQRPAGRRTIVIGAGAAAERLLRHVRHEGGQEINVVALVDDDPLKHGRLLHSVPVVGGTGDLARIAAEHRAELLVIAIPSATGQQARRIAGRCIAAKVEFKILPSLPDLLGRSGRRAELRSVQIEDLLGRAVVSLELAELEADIAGKVVLVSGGAGSIGSELARQIARHRPAKLVLLEQAETPLYFAHLELTSQEPDLEIIPVIGSVTDEERLEQVFRAYRPDHVYHAAAYKHVPLMERNIIEAVCNNVFGTLRLAVCAARHGVEKFVLISTDKAVNPSSIMGATKRIAERIALELPALRASATDFRVVRFGNVLGSDGSVLPLFKRQLSQGGPLTVTHPDVTRFFMTIPEAAQLVLEAAALPEAARRIAMLDMGEPVRLVDLAENVIRLAGLEPYRDVPIVFTGLRPGEKLAEELIAGVEETVPSSVEKIRLVQRQELDGAAIERGIQRLSAAVLLGSVHDLLLEIRALVPECVAPLCDSAARADGLRQREVRMVMSG